MDAHKELAKKWLKRYTVPVTMCFRGVPISEFTQEELIKILYVYSGLIKQKDETIDCLSRL